MRLQRTSQTLGGLASLRIGTGRKHRRSPTTYHQVGLLTASFSAGMCRTVAAPGAGMVSLAAAAAVPLLCTRRLAGVADELEVFANTEIRRVGARARANCDCREAGIQSAARTAKSGTNNKATWVRCIQEGRSSDDASIREL